MREEVDCGVWASPDATISVSDLLPPPPIWEQDTTTAAVESGSGVGAEGKDSRVPLAEDGADLGVRNGFHEPNFPPGFFPPAADDAGRGTISGLKVDWAAAKGALTEALRGLSESAGIK